MPSRQVCFLSPCPMKYMLCDIAWVLGIVLGQALSLRVEALRWNQAVTAGLAGVMPHEQVSGGGMRLVKEDGSRSCGI